MWAALQEPRLCLVYAVSPLHDPGFIRRLREAIAGLASGSGVRVVDRGVASSASELSALLQGCDGGVVVVGTGGTEHVVLGGIAGFEGPILLVAHPYANSLPALLELYPLARRLRASPLVLPGLEGGEAASALSAGLHGLWAAARMRGSRLGLFGKPSPWLVYSRVDPGTLRERLGVEVVEVGLDRVEEAYRSVSLDRKVLEEVVSRAASVERPQEEVERALRLYAALRRLVEEERLDALTVECFEVIPRLGTTACLALSLFNSSGLPAGCEGDVPATLSMMLAFWATRSPVFMANPAAVKSRELLLAHCTAPITAGRYRLLSHFETGKGIGVSVEYRAGEEVTIARIDPRLELLRLGSGRVSGSGLLSSLHCRTQVWVKVDWDPRILLEESIGNHYVMVLGGHVEALRHAGRLLGLRVEVLG